MKTRVTMIGLALVCLMVGLVSTSDAQPVRNGEDAIWLRDVEGAEMTLDGVLDEEVWDQAETIELVWDGDHPFPGSGQRTDRAQVDWTAEEPTDPINAVVSVLRDGNMLWLALEAEDLSVGGQTNLWNLDGIIMTVLDPSQVPENVESEMNVFGNGHANSEFVASWWNPADTTDSESEYDDGSPVGEGQTIPGDELRLFSGEYGVGFGEGNIERDQELVDIWDAVATVDGIVNDDTHGDDDGYIIEMYLDLGEMGYDFSQTDGDKAAWSIAVNDVDYVWPRSIDPDRSYNSRVWWQNQWTNNFNEGAAYLLGAPDVTVSSGAAPEVTEPEVTIQNGSQLDAPEIDGILDEEQWTEIDPSYYLQYQTGPDYWAQNAGLLAQRHYSFFRPNLGEGTDQVVVDPTEGRIKMFFIDKMLYVGLDADDQAISGAPGEDGRDGFRIALRQLDSLDAEQTPVGRQFDFSIDSSGVVNFAEDAAVFADEGAVEAAVHLKGASTAADPQDIDEGYQMEIAIDLESLGYTEDDDQIWFSLNYFDGDFLAQHEDSYATRTWIVGERSEAPSIYGYLDPNELIGTAAEDLAEIPQNIRLEGNYPNPFNPSTTIRYALPNSGDVTVRVFDALGRSAGELQPGMQTAGRHTVEFDASHLASGVYFYRVDLENAAGTDVRSTVGRMILLK